MIHTAALVAPKESAICFNPERRLPPRLIHAVLTRNTRLGLDSFVFFRILVPNLGSGTDPRSGASNNYLG